MNRFEKANLLVTLAERLRANGIWAGEHHLQKAAYVLERVMGVPVEFDFILYKHGPFSFDLRDEIYSLRAEGFFEWEVKSQKEGPSLIPGPMSGLLRRQFGGAVDAFIPKIDFVASHLGKRNMAELERLGTAIFVTFDEPLDRESRATRINELERHVSLPEAETAVRDADQLIGEAQTAFPLAMTA